MATEREMEALADANNTKTMLSRVDRMLQQRFPQLQLQSTSGDYDPSGHENEDGSWTRYQSTNDPAGTLPCGP